jgi:hypothetical protein
MPGYSAGAYKSHSGALMLAKAAGLQLLFETDKAFLD